GDADGNLVDVTEHTKIEPVGEVGARSFSTGDEWKPIALDSITSMNMWGFDPSLFTKLDVEFRAFLEKKIGDPKSEFFIPTVVDALIKRAECRCKILKTDEQWFGV